MSNLPVDTRIEFDWDEVVPMLLRDRGITSGLWSFGVRFTFGAGNAGPREQILPTAVTGVHGLSLRRVDQLGPLVFDAATMKRADEKPALKPPKAVKSAKIRKTPRSTMR